MLLSDLSANKPLMVRSYSGNELHTLLIPAESIPNKTLIVHFHGNAANITWTAQRYGWLKNYGFDVLVFDYSGYGQSSGTASAKVMWQDAVTMLDYALELKKKQPDRWDNIIVAGTSLGGNVLLNALADYRFKNKLDKVFIDSSFLSYEGVAASIVRSKPGGTVAEWVARLIISDEYAPIEDTPISFNQPVVVAHCNSDQLIDAKLGREVYDSLIAENKQWLLLQGCAHAQGFFEEHPENRQRLVRIFNERQ